MATLSSTLAWKILWREEPSGPQFIRSQRVSHEWVTGTILNFHYASNGSFLIYYAIYFSWQTSFSQPHNFLVLASELLILWLSGDLTYNTFSYLAGLNFFIFLIIYSYSFVVSSLCVGTFYDALLIKMICEIIRYRCLYK